MYADYCSEVNILLFHFLWDVLNWIIAFGNGLVRRRSIYMDVTFSFFLSTGGLKRKLGQKKSNRFSFNFKTPANFFFGAKNRKGMKNELSMFFIITGKLKPSDWSKSKLSDVKFSKIVRQNDFQRFSTYLKKMKRGRKKNKVFNEWKINIDLFEKAVLLFF